MATWIYHTYVKTVSQTKTIVACWHDGSILNNRRPSGLKFPYREERAARSACGTYHPLYPYLEAFMYELLIGQQGYSNVVRLDFPKKLKMVFRKVIGAQPAF